MRPSLRHAFTFSHSGPARCKEEGRRCTSSATMTDFDKPNSVLWATEEWEIGQLRHGLATSTESLMSTPLPIFWGKVKERAAVAPLFPPHSSQFSRLLTRAFMTSEEKDATLDMFSVCEGHVHRVRPPARRSFRLLDNIPSTKIDIDLLKKWDLQCNGNAREVLTYIESQAGFMQSLSGALEELHIRRSSIPLENRLRLEEWNTVVKMDKPRCYLKAFQVEKKSEFDRLVLDATPLNCRSKKAPVMHISTIQSILRDILGFTVAATVDACAYFYQFPIAEDVIPFFSIAFSKRKGSVVSRALTRLCMGWRFAPCIAQRCSNTLLMELRRRLPEQVFYANVWLDNFFFAANDTVSLQHVIDTFLVISSEVNLKLHEFTDISPALNILGFAVDLDKKLIRLGAPESSSPKSESY